MTKPSPSSRIRAKRRRAAPRRVNARLDHGYAAKLKVLVERRGSVTEALKYAIDVGYREVTTAQARRRILDGLVGAFEGPEDLSTNYKEYLSESLARKHGLGR